MVENTIADFPYIPCPPDPMERVAELEIQIKNLASMVNTMKTYLETVKPTIDWLTELKIQHEEKQKKQMQELMWWFTIN